MRNWTVVLMLISFSAIGQRLDSLDQKTKLDAKFNKFDSLNLKANKKIDSIQSVISQPTQINASGLKEKLISRFKKRADSLSVSHNEGDSSKHTIIRENLAKSKKYISKVDSVGGTNITPDKYIRLPDSLSHVDPARKVREAESKITSAQQQVDGKIQKPIQDATSGVSNGMNRLSKEAYGQGNLPANLQAPGDISSQSGDLSLPKTDMPGVDLPKDKLKTEIGGDLNVDKLKGEVNNPLKGKLKESTDKLDLKNKAANATNSEEIKNLKTASSEVNGKVDKLQTYSQEAKDIKNGDFEKATELKKEITSKLPSGEMKGVSDQLNMGNEEMRKLQALKNKEAFKKQTMEKAREAVVQQLTLNHAKMMDPVKKISAYQRKSGTMITAAKDLPKRPRKSKKPPLIERFIPGVTFQVQKSAAWMVDLNPTLRFKIRSILSTGLGYNYRFVFDTDGKYLSDKSIQGFRSFTEFSIRKGLSVRADVERMNAFVPEVYNQPDVGGRKDVWTFMAGLRKDFSFGTYVLGNVQFMYNVYDPRKQSPYVNRFNVRFGFEFPIKKSKTKKKPE